MQSFVIESVSTVGVGQPPNVEFFLSEDRTYFTADPDGARIIVTKIGDKRSRIELRDDVLGFVSADVEVNHWPVPHHPGWEDDALYAGEIACALYWSQWRMQQVRKQAQGGGE